MNLSLMCVYCSDNHKPSFVFFIYFLFSSHLAEHLNELIYRHRLRRLSSLRARMICFLLFFQCIYCTSFAPAASAFYPKLFHLLLSVVNVYIYTPPPFSKTTLPTPPLRSVGICLWVETLVDVYVSQNQLCVLSIRSSVFIQKKKLKRKNQKFKKRENDERALWLFNKERN